MSLSEKLSAGWRWFLRIKSEDQPLAMFHPECQPMTITNIRTYMKLPLFKVDSIINHAIPRLFHQENYNKYHLYYQ